MKQNTFWRVVVIQLCNEIGYKPWPKSLLRTDNEALIDKTKTKVQIER